MAAKSKQSYKYVAHVQDKDGKVKELTGTREAATTNKVYQYLLQRATELGGWLLNQDIEKTDNDEVMVERLPKIVRTSQQSVDLTKLPTFGKTGVFGEFNSDYSGSRRMIFKEK